MEPISLITAILGGLAPLVKAVIEFAQQKTRERALAQESFETALGSADLRTLGKYLDDHLGAIDVERYARDDAARSKVDLVLAQLEKFLGPTEESDDSEVPSPPSEAAKRVPETKGLPEDVVARLNAGDEWGALVRLRVFLELASNEVLQAHGVSVQASNSLGGLTEFLRREGLVTADVIGAMRFAGGIANRAAHGKPIAQDELAAALRAGGFALLGLKRAAKLS